MAQPAISSLTAPFEGLPLSGQNLGRQLMVLRKLRHRETVSHADVARNTHFGNVESYSFGLRVDTESNDQIDRFEHDKGECPYGNKVCSHPDAFGKEL